MFMLDKEGYLVCVRGFVLIMLYNRGIGGGEKRAMVTMDIILN